MPQIIEENRRPSFGQKFSNAVGVGLQGGNQIMQENSQKEAIANLLGKDISRLPHDFQKMAFDAALEEQANMKKLSGNAELDLQTYNTIEKTFGKTFADVYKASPAGGRTEMLKYGLDARARGIDLDESLKNVDLQALKDFSNQEDTIPKEVPQSKNGNFPKDYKWPDLTKRPPGYTPREWNDERRTWRKENAPIFEKNKTQIKNIKRDELGITKLNTLNKKNKLPSGFERLLINPESGEFYGLAQLAEMVSPEAQEWVKEIARFQNRAKDAFGSRVTNFDLQSYMKQFPGLLNTSEGRERILKMMNINNKLDYLYENSLNQVYKKYGLAGIPQEKADEIAKSVIEKETERLENEFNGIDEENLNQKPEGLSGRTVDVRGPDGQIYEVDESEVEELPEGYRVI